MSYLLWYDEEDDDSYKDKIEQLLKYCCPF